MRFSLAIAILCSVVVASVSTSYADPKTDAASRAQLAFFEKKVRPILAAHCFKCHGSKKQESGLRLDSRAAVIKGGDSGPAVSPGKPGESRLIDALHFRDGLEMPPDGKLPPQEIATITEWIHNGLPWPNSDPTTNPADSQSAWKSHWAFQPIRKPELPHVINADWPRTSIDNFILAKLEQQKLSPSGTADRKTLIRRATFDLIGLPPTPQEIDDFQSDASADAYEKVIDRLLASPHYGQRWGRYWLDVARYADNKGYVFFEDKKFPWAYTYRDYVVDALNADLPYDRFLLEQLAADRLDLGDDKRPLAAMGFLTLGGRFMNNMHDIIDDRIDVVSRGLLGLTATCARCHDHKFDPIPQEDYYALYGVFRSSSEPIVPPLFTPPPETEQYRTFDVEMKTRSKKLDDFVASKHNELVTSARTRAAEYLMAAHTSRDLPPTDAFMLLVDKGELNPTMIRRWQNYLKTTRRQQHPVWLIWHRLANAPTPKFTTTLSALLSKMTKHVDKKNPVNPLVLSAVAEKPPASMAELAACYSKLLLQIEQKWKAELQRGDKNTRSKPVELADPHEEQLRRVFYGPGAPPDVPTMTGWGFLTLLPDRTSQKEFETLLKEVEKWSTTGAGAPPRAMVLVEQKHPYNPRIFLRGNSARLGRPVERHFLGVLDPARKPFQQGGGRLELAEAIIDPQNPLTARVFVNRLWMHHFGSPLVETPSDFGMQSRPPSHPKLLDHLATRFIENGWSIKHMHRLMMLSSTYRQQSSPSRNVPAIDPENRLLWRMNRRRLDFEGMRDALLAASGDLDATIGGPPVDILGKDFPRRRTIYGFVNRMDLPGLFRSFDFPEPSATSPKRDMTTVAPQALFLMNNRFVVEAARRGSQRAEIASLSDNDQKITQSYRLLFGRPPTKNESVSANEFLGAKSPPARWSQYFQALLMTNEFVFID